MGCRAMRLWLTCAIGFVLAERELIRDARLEITYAGMTVTLNYEGHVDVENRANPVALDRGTIAQLCAQLAAQSPAVAAPAIDCHTDLANMLRDGALGAAAARAATARSRRVTRDIALLFGVERAGTALAAPLTAALRLAAGSTAPRLR